jgi:NAD(P)-dependent dehydrogenase (short-subunit alcohol dehydrogenase family)
MRKETAERLDERKDEAQPQAQSRPGREQAMKPQPESRGREYAAANKLLGKVALVTGGDSGIGRAVSVLFAREGADVAVAYLDEHEDAEETRRLVESHGHRCLLLAGDLGRSAFCREAVERTVRELGRIDILVNNAAEQTEQKDFEALSDEQIERTFRTNIFSQFFLTREALKHLGEDASIINTTSVVAYQGKGELVDYAATKGAIVAFTRSMAMALAPRKIRVNAVAPGPIWTPLIPSTFDKEHIEKFGENTLLQRMGQPDEVATSYVFLASADASYMTGQVLHPNGGRMVGS